MNVEKAIELGRLAGRDAVNDFRHEFLMGSRGDHEGLSEALLDTVRAGHVPWSESAINARAHALDGVPDDDEMRLAYYRAYDDGARARIAELTAD